MKRSEKIIFGILTLGLLAVLVIGSTLAYMTDRENKENTFTVGTLDVSLEEKNWDDDTDGDEAVPGDTFVKDPVVTAVKNDSYIRVRVTIKDSATGRTISDADRLALICQMIKYDSTYKADTQTPGTAIVKDDSYSSADLAAMPMVNPAFTQVTSSTAGEYVFNFNEILEEGGKVALFTNLVVPSDWSQVQLDVVGAFKIDVVVEAIQAKNFDTSAEAFAALDEEIRNGTNVSNYVAG